MMNPNNLALYKASTEYFKQDPKTLQFYSVDFEDDDTLRTLQGIGSVVVRTHPRTELISFYADFRNKELQYALGVKMLGVNFATIRELTPNCSFFDDECTFYFHAENPDKLGDVYFQEYRRYHNLRDNLAQTSKLSRKKIAKELEHFDSYEEYRAFRAGAIFFVIFNICRKYNMTFVQIPSCRLDRAF